MANKTLFSSIKSLLPRADSHNEAGAYKFMPKHALAQIAWAIQLDPDHRHGVVRLG